MELVEDVDVEVAEVGEVHLGDVPQGPGGVAGPRPIHGRLVEGDPQERRLSPHVLDSAGLAGDPRRSHEGREVRLRQPRALALDRGVGFAFRRHRQLLSRLAAGQAETNWWPITFRSVTWTMTPFRTPTLYSLPGFSDRDGPIRADPLDSWMWPCSERAGLYRSIADRTAWLPTGIIRACAPPASERSSLSSGALSRPVLCGGGGRLKIAGLVASSRSTRRSIRFSSSSSLSSRGLFHGVGLEYPSERI